MVDHQTGEFFHRNASLLTLFAVLGATTVGLTTSLTTSPWKRLVVVASLLMFLLTALSLREHVSQPGSRQSPVEYVMSDLAYRADVGMFYGVYWIYIAAVFGYVFSYLNILGLFVLCFMLLIGIFLSRKWVVWANPGDRTEIDITPDNEAGQFLTALAQNGLLASLAGISGILVLSVTFGFPGDALLAVQFPALFDALWIGVFAGISIGGTLYTLFAAWNYAYNCGYLTREDPVG